MYLGIIIHDCFISGGKEKSLQCDLCPKKFAYQSHLDRHKVTHSNASYVDIKREFQCALCPCSYSHKPSLRSHMVKEHPSELLLASKKARICIFYRCLKPLEQWELMLKKKEKRSVVGLNVGFSTDKTLRKNAWEKFQFWPLLDIMALHIFFRSSLDFLQKNIQIQKEKLKQFIEVIFLLGRIHIFVDNI